MLLPHHLSVKNSRLVFPMMFYKSCAHCYHCCHCCIGYNCCKDYNASVINTSSIIHLNKSSMKSIIQYILICMHSSPLGGESDDTQWPMSPIMIISKFNKSAYYINDYINFDLIWNIGIGFGFLSTSSSLFYNLVTFISNIIFF